MHLTPSSPRRAGRCILVITIVLLSGPSGFTQAPHTGQSFPTHDNPRVVISNASRVSIVSWHNREVSVAAEVLGAAAKTDEVKIKFEDNKLEISCQPSKPDRNISLTLRVPAKAVLEIRTFGNTVHVKEPDGQITISSSEDLIQLSVPESSSLDMQEAPHASARRRLGQGGFATFSIGRNRIGIGRPYVKVTAATAQVAIGLGPIEPLSGPALTQPQTQAAQAIARLNTSMSEALRRSKPQLVRPSFRIDKTAQVNSAEKEESALKLETYLVNLNVGATDREGRSIPGLKQDDFRIFEDGVQQRISFFSPQQAQFNLVLLIDLSGSMRDRIGPIIETALHFLDVISSQDSVAVVTFTTDVTVVSHLTKDRNALRESISSIRAPAGGTAFYDALGYALVEELGKVKGQRNAVIAITDGEDNALQTLLAKASRPLGMSLSMSRIPFSPAGSFLTFGQLLDGVAEADALIYPIHLSPTQLQQRDLPPAPKSAESVFLLQAEMTATARKQLQELADASGGRCYHSDRIEDLNGVFEQVAAELRTVYSIAYTPVKLNFDGRFRRIRVQVDKPDIAIRTRPGYYGR
jgi:VWFA-related protein